MSETFDDSYVKAIKTVLEDGSWKKNPRTGVNTLSDFNVNIQATDDCYGWHSIPISKTRKIHWKGALIEAMWLLGMHRESYKDLPATNIKYLVDNGVNYWKPWADENGNLGPVYGKQIFDWNGYNQIENIIKTLRENPDDRRLVVNMWNPSDIPDMALPPCHYSFEFYSQPLYGAKNTRVLHTRWIQRSADLPIGIPYNVLIYAFINKIIAFCTKHIPGYVYGSLGDAHIYENQMESVKEMLSRWDSTSNDFKNKITRFSFSDNLFDKIYGNGNGCLELSDFALDGSDFIVEDYEPLGAIKIPVTV